MKSRKAISAAVAGALMLLGTAAISPAAANAECGAIITTDFTLTHDLGPCPGMGLIVRANNITVDLGGHRIFAANGPEETIGVRLGNVSGVTLQNGTVEGFDAGVEILSGGGNTVQRITAQNNINDMDEPFVHTPGQALPPEQIPLMLCFYGDGITTSDSDDNVIRNNRVIGNGPYGGITLVGDSDENLVEKNTVLDNNIHNWTIQNTPDGPREGVGLCGATLPGAPGMQRGRRIQAMGIRIEGPGASENVVSGNFVDNSALVGISIHSWVCNPEPGEPRPGFPNEFNLITHNTVRRTGLETVAFDPFADGISSLAQGPIGRVTCTSHNNTIVNNNSSDNLRHGFSLHVTVRNTEVSGNVAQRNAGNGVFVAGPVLNQDGTLRTAGASDNTLHRNRAHNNALDDGFDGNPNCDNNSWMRNRFGYVNQVCVANGGTGWVGGPGKSGDAPGHTESQGMSHSRPQN